VHAAATTQRSPGDDLTAIQDVAAGLAHELRNPVFSIASAAQLLRYRVGDDPVIETNVGRILREVERLNGLVAALLEFGRPAPPHLVEGNPDEAWERALAAHRGAIESKGLHLRRTAPSGHARRPLDIEQLTHAFSNLLSNAIEAAPPHTDLTISSGTAGDGSWRASLTNAGPAVPADMLPRVFDLLTTTKSGHAGVGLPIAQRIVAAHGGAMQLVSDAMLGTTVTVVLP